MAKSLVNQDYWDQSYRNYRFIAVSSDSQIWQWIKKNIQVKKGATCFEVGCFPGSFLAKFGEIGYQLSGLDLTPRVATDLPIWLKSLGFKVGRIKRADFLTYRSSQKYDLVCSFGFIEHFDNWKEVIVRHTYLVKKGGYLIITTPNFSGLVQRGFHFFLDLKNYQRHNIASMDPDAWAKILRRLNYKIIAAGYFGKFDFWYECEAKNKFQRPLAGIVSKLAPHLGRLSPDNRFYSPFCGIIARKL